MDGSEETVKIMPKRYRVIVKVGNLPDGRAQCLKYRVDNLRKFTAFLDSKWPAWRWFNVYANRGEAKGTQLESFTKNKRPVSDFL
jgi:hypothetical protein